MGFGAAVKPPRHHGWRFFFMEIKRGSKKAGDPYRDVNL
jgi:hypothetical protein